MATVGLFDNLEFTLVDSPGVVLSCDDPAIPCDGSNLIVRTASAILEMSRAADKSRSVRGVAAALHKRIPVGAGLGGGSSDGAFTLVALNQLLGANYGAETLGEIAARFGSDLSFFLYGSSSVCTGRGEIVRPIARPKPRYVVLISPVIHMATPAVYRRFDAMGLGDPETLRNAPDWRKWSTLDSLELLPLLVNDLETPAFALNSQLAELHRAATSVAGRTVRMSGSGSSLFTLFDDLHEAEISADQLRLKLGVTVRAVELCPEIDYKRDGNS